MRVKNNAINNEIFKILCKNNTEFNFDNLQFNRKIFILCFLLGGLFAASIAVVDLLFLFFHQVYIAFNLMMIILFFYSNELCSIQAILSCSALRSINKSRVTSSSPALAISNKLTISLPISS
jgi:hypothetical protein